MKRLLSLAIPSTLIYLGINLLSFVDTALVSKLGNDAVAITSVSNSIFNTWLVFGLGFMYVSDFFISSSRGEGQIEKANAYFVNTFYLSFIVTIAVMALILMSREFLSLLSMSELIREESYRFTGELVLGLFPVFVFTAVRVNLSAHESVVGVVWILALSNLLNYFLVDGLVNGKYGLPNLGVHGCAHANTIARWFMFFSAMAVLKLNDLRLHRRALAQESSFPKRSWKFDKEKITNLIRLGAPLAFSMVFEVGVFGLVTLFAAKLGTAGQAAHQVTMNYISMTFMCILGLSSASSVLVGYYYGAKDYTNLVKVADQSIFITLGFMFFCALCFWFLPDVLLIPFSLSPESQKIVTYLFKIAAVFQLVDGLQCVLSGILRGVGSTRFAAITNIIAHWGVGLPTAVYLLFYAKIGINSLWYGLSLGIFCVAALLSIRWLWVRSRLLLGNS